MCILDLSLLFKIQTFHFVLLLYLTLSVEAVVQETKIDRNYYWRDYNGTVPADAVNGTACLYIAQIYYEGILPGTLYDSRKEAVTECRGFRRIIKYPIKVLCDRRKDNFVWEHVNIDWLTKEKLEDKVIGGYEVGFDLYIGRTFHQGEWKIGKVFPPTRGAYKGLTVWYNDGKQYITHDFEILKYLDKSAEDNFKPCIGNFDVRIQ